MNKKHLYLFSITLFLLHSTAVYGQHSGTGAFQNLTNYDKKLYHLGIYVGMSAYDLALATEAKSAGESASGEYLVTTQSKPGINAGLVAELKLHDNITFRLEPGINLVTRELFFANVQNFEQRTRIINSTYVDAPAVFKFTSDRLGNFKPYCTAEYRFSYNLTSQEDQPKDNASEIFRTTTINHMYGFGFGIDIYTPLFKFSPVIKGIFGINNELKDDNPDTPPNWAGVIERVSTKAVVFSIYFEGFWL